MKQSVKIVSVGAFWGCLEATVFFLAFLFPVNVQYNGAWNFSPFGNPFAEGLFFAALISFTSGIVLADKTNTVEGLLIASFAASLVFLLATIVFLVTVPISIAYDGPPHTKGETELILFGAITPLIFLTGFLMSSLGAMLGDRIVDRREYRAHPPRPLPPL